MTRQYDSVQLLRAVAAFAVVFFHVFDSIENDFGLTRTNLFELGSSGVDIFFVISGFIICLVTQPGSSRLHFAAKRIARIVPLYWLLTLGVFAVAAIAPSLLNSTTANLGNLAKSLLFIPYLKENGAPQPILFLGWTLNYEMFFYGIFAVAMTFGRYRLQVVTGVLLALFAIGVLFPQPDNAIYSFYTADILLNFIWGIGVYTVFRQAPGFIERLRPFWFLAVALLIGQLWFPIPLPQVYSFGLPGALLLASILTLSIGSNRVGRLAVDLGNASYSIYLIHPYIIQVFVKAVLPVVGANLLSVGLVTTLTLILTSLAALAMFHWFEVPSNRWLRAKLLRQKADGPLTTGVRTLSRRA